MASNTRRRETIAKRNRERAVKEKRALKQEKREARKQAAAEPRDGENYEAPEEVDSPPDPSTLEPPRTPSG